MNTIGTVLFFLAHLVWFLLVFKSFRSRQDIPRLALFVGSISSLYAIYGLVIFFTGNETVLWYKKWVSLGELTSTFVNRNSFAAYIGIGFQCMLAYALWIFTKKMPVNLSIKEKFIQFFSKDLSRTVGITLALIVLITSLFLTASRAGILTSLIGSALLILTSVMGRTPYGTEGTKQSRRYFFIASLSLIGLLTFNLSGELFSKRLENISQDDTRFLVYPIMRGLLEDNPIKGTGIGAFAEVFAQGRTVEIPSTFNKGHSDILEIIMTAGLLAGGFFILSLLFITTWTFHKAFKSSEYNIFLLLGGTVSVQIGLHSLVDFSLQMPAVSYTVTGILAACAFVISKENISIKS